jgi:hypothetical protein
MVVVLEEQPFHQGQMVDVEEEVRTVMLVELVILGIMVVKLILGQLLVVVV